MDNYPTFPVNHHYFHFLLNQENAKPRKNVQRGVWNPHGKSGTVFAGPHASASTLYAGMLKSWDSVTGNIPVQAITGKLKKVGIKATPHPYYEISTKTAKDSFNLMEGRYSKNYGVDQQRLQVSELHFDKFPTPATFSHWMICLKTEVCSMIFFLRVLYRDTLLLLISSCSTRGLHLS